MITTSSDLHATPQRIALQLNRVLVVEQTVENGVGARRLPQVVVPTLRRQLRGDQHRLAGHADVDDFQEILAPAPTGATPQSSRNSTSTLASRVRSEPAAIFRYSFHHCTKFPTYRRSKLPYRAGARPGNLISLAMSWHIRPFPWGCPKSRRRELLFWRPVWNRCDKRQSQHVLRLMLCKPLLRSARI